ncbi:MAG TPA: hypothetical protein PLE42_11980 [Candidatus Competibacteraceae bacterium]|nr:hypothetical protein [Candidatus Competibacteraceae bacterium]
MVEFSGDEQSTANWTVKSVAEALHGMAVIVWRSHGAEADGLD